MYYINTYSVTHHVYITTITITQQKHQNKKRETELSQMIRVRIPFANTYLYSMYLYSMFDICIRMYETTI